ncbi:hypothetical protein [Salinisphaera sp. G21_0]|uniref:hypothetical protein n=1 Tax=Salinisphaera sp. G21_0 TaxID=2821094 RepID=UPI001AD9C586|nr:hypothetical protein [Salinisphaera sp. G21_0]MBO9484199.1 hypothetical protein [Salinisphaera sp. G21_0]
MNVIRGMNCFSCLSDRHDQKSGTGSGQCTTTELSKRLPVPSREDERKALLWAAQSGCLAIRQIESAEEANFFKGYGTPKSFTLAQQGMTRRKWADQQKWVVGIVDPDCLYVYKKEADTWRLEQGVAADKLGVKLLPDLPSLAEKDEEIQQRAWWDVYPRSTPDTSGHLGPNGKFSLPKPKPYKYNAPKSVSTNFNDPVPRSEIVVTPCGTANIKCFFVERDTARNISDILRQKRRCEQALGLPLPLVVFCRHTGSVEVCYDDELASEHLTIIEDSLDVFASSRRIPSGEIRRRMNLLPMPLQAQALSSGLSIPPDDQPKWQQAIQLVSHPCDDNYRELLALKASGLSIHRCFFHEGNITSLLDMLLTSESLRYTEAHDRVTEFRVDKVAPLLRLLLKIGAIPTALSWSLIRQMGEQNQLLMPPDLFNYMLAAFAPFKFLTLKNLWNIPLTSVTRCSGSIIEFDRICQDFNDQQRQHCLKEELSRNRLLQRPTLDTLQSHLLALFHYGAVPDEEVMDTVKRDLTYFDDNTRLIDNLSVPGFIEWVGDLWMNREAHTLFQNWPAHVEEARQQLAKLKQSLDLPVDPFASVTPVLQFMVDAFSKPPVLPENVGDNEDTIFKVLQHYYRRPGPERVIASLRNSSPVTWKEHHSCSHVLRARNNGLWYMELLEKCKVHSFTPIEKRLLPLAIIYQDAAYKDVDESAVKTKSADYFKRDLAGHYPEKLLNDMALAMVSMKTRAEDKAVQNLSEPVRRYLRVLRFAVHINQIRYSGVRPFFPALAVAPHKVPKAEYLGLPTQLANDFSSEPDHQTEFQRHLEAAMHGAADLMQLQVANCPSDKRENPYTQVYGLVPDGKKITIQFDRTTKPVEIMDRFINDKVRRKLAREAGIITCSDPDHQNCRADLSKGVTYGIHNSWYDLRQVKVPAEMTRLEKMQYEHDPSLLSPATQQALAEEVQRLKSAGIRMNTGTLTQETLASKDALKVLEDRGIAVVSEKRPYVANDGLPGEWEMLVPIKMAKPVTPI